MYDFGLIVTSNSHTLPSVVSFYLEFEDQHTENVEEGYDTKSERLFWIKHNELNRFIAKMGESNFFLCIVFF